MLSQATEGTWSAEAGEFCGIVLSDIREPRESTQLDTVFLCA